MIAPGTRLIVWVALLLPSIPVGLLAPEAWWVPAVLYGALAATALTDGLLSGVRDLRVTIPGTLRMSRGRDAAIQVLVHNPGARHRRLRVSLSLPASIKSAGDPMDISLPRGKTDSTFQWNCVPAERGAFTLRACYFESPSRLGFWDMRGRTECISELRVYPNLHSERKRLASLFLNRGNYGAHARRIVGQGREFERLREYMPGDGYGDIHWKATAKRGKPVTKLYQVERTQEVYCVVDSSRLSGRVVGDDAVIENSINAALILALAAEQQGDLFGLITFGRTIDRFIRAGSGKSHFNTCRDALYSVEPQLTSPDFGELMSFIRLRLRRRALLVFLTDLADPLLADNFQRDVSKVSRQHLVFVCMPGRPEAVPLFSKADATNDADVYARLAGHIAWRRLRELETSLRRQGVALAHVAPSQLSTQVVARYMNVKSRQLI